MPCPTQAKGGLEWATRGCEPLSNRILNQSDHSVDDSKVGKTDGQKGDV